MNSETDQSSLNQKRASRNLVSLYFASFIILSGYSVIVPFLPIYANDILSEFNIIGITIGIALQIGIITAGNLIMKFFLAPAFGDLSDIEGRKPIILVGMSVYTLLMAGYGLANDFFSLFMLRVLSGVASAAVWPVGEALVVDVSSKDRVGRNLGFYMLSMMLGATSGPFIGYIFYFGLHDLQGLTVLDSYRLTFVCVALLGLIATLFVVLFVKDSKSVQQEEFSLIMLYRTTIKKLLVKTIKSPIFLFRTLSTRSEYRTRSIYTIYIVAAINGFATALLIPIMALFLEEYYSLDPGSIALTIGIVGVLSLFGAPVGGILSDSFGRKATVVSSGVASGLVLMLVGLKTGIEVLIIIFTLIRVFFTILQPSFRALQSDIIPEEVRGKEFGIVQATFNFGSILGPIVGGFLYDLYNNVRFDIGSGLEFFGVGFTFTLSGMLVIFAAVLILARVDSKKIITKAINK
ncbi:MAG: MFS transporter [Candidatus Hodarchaeales archaeon]|jgi:MFS family permease